MSKLSELVAVEVMGAKVITTIDPVPDGIYVRNGAVYYGNDAGRNRCERFTPDTNIADAWRVVEKCVRFTPELFYGEGQWTCFMHNLEVDDSFPLSCRDENVCVAICLAALRACGVDEQRIAAAKGGGE
jgi:hypothetical protein